MSNDKAIALVLPEQKDALTEVLVEGARRLLHQAMNAEVETLMDSYRGEKTRTGQQRVVRNGYHPERELLTGIGPVAVKVPKVRSKEGAPVSFQSALIPRTSERLQH